MEAKNAPLLRVRGKFGAMRDPERAVYPQPILGWREWTIDPDRGGELALWPLFDHSVINPRPWSGDPNEPASCLMPDHHSPEHDCFCGWHAWFSPDKMHAWRRWRSANPHEISVAGAIAGSGRVELHRDGFRCERAQILCLTFGGPAEERAAQREVADRYKIPIFKSRFKAKRYAATICPEALPLINLPDYDDQPTPDYPLLP